MILRAFKKPVVDDTGRLDHNEIKEISVFRKLPEPLLKSAAEHCEKVPISKGNWEAPDDPEFQYFLLSGELFLSTEGRPPVKLDQSSIGAKYPLPLTGWNIAAQGPATLLKVPDRYLDLLRNSQPSTRNGIELHESDDEAELYMELQQTLNNGNFNLPVLPDLALQIGKAIDDPATDNNDIARLIQLDPALGTRIMSVVNSAAFAGVTTIRSLPQAVSRLGRQQVRNLVYSCIIKDLFQSESPVLTRQMQKLWSHSRKVGAIASVLARRTPGLDPDQALLAGLIHDIGSIPLLNAAQSTPGLLESPSLLERLVDEMKAEIGQLTLQKWDFSEELCHLALHAEDWFRPGTAVADYLDVVLIAQLHAFAGSALQQHLPHMDQVPAFDKLALGRLTPEHSLAVLHEAEKEIGEIEKLLN